MYQTCFISQRYTLYIPSFFTSFLFLFSFFRASTSMYGTLLALASSQCCWSPRTHTCILGRGICFNLITKWVYQYSLLLSYKISGRIISEQTFKNLSRTHNLPTLKNFIKPLIMTGKLTIRLTSHTKDSTQTPLPIIPKSQLWYQPLLAGCKS